MIDLTRPFLQLCIVVLLVSFLSLDTSSTAAISTDAFVWNREPGHVDNFTSTSDSAGVIDVVPMQGTNTATMNTSVQLQGRPAAPDARWIVFLHMIVTPEGNSIPVFDHPIMTNENGQFELDGLAAGNYRVWVKGKHTLATAQVITVAAGANQVNVGTLREGDADGNNLVNLTDFSLLAATFGKQSGDADYDARADFNGDDVVNLLDFSLLATNFGQAGDDN